MGNFISIPILLVAAIIQATLIPQIRLLGGAPDLVFLIVLSWSINARLEENIVWSFMGGIFHDLLSAAPTGTSVMGMLIVVFGISGVGQQVYSIGFLLLAGSVIIGTIIKQLIAFFILTLAGYSINVVFATGYVLAPTIIYNIIMIWPVYWVIRGIQKRTTRPGGFSIR